MSVIPLATAGERDVLTVIGFVDPNADRIVHVNNLREKQFGVSPKDRSALNAAVLAALRKTRVVRVARAA